MDTVPKVPVSIRLDADVVDGFRDNYSPYQSEMNKALREYLIEKGHIEA